MEADPGILADVPRLSLDIENLKLNVSVDARIAELLNLSLVVDTELGKTDIDLKDLDAQVAAILRLDNVRAIVERVVDMIERNPHLITETLSRVGGSLEGVGKAADGALNRSGRAPGVAEKLGKLTGAVAGASRDDSPRTDTASADLDRGIVMVTRKASRKVRDSKGRLNAFAREPGRTVARGRDDRADVYFAARGSPSGHGFAQDSNP